MLLSFNKTLKAINQLAKKKRKKKEVSAVRATFDKIFSQFFFFSVTHKFL